MKYVVSLLVLLSIASVWANEKADKLAEKNGGLVRIKGKGCVAAIDCRAKEGRISPADGITRFGGCYGIDVKTVNGEPFTFANATGQLKNSGANAAVFIVDDPSLPMTLLALEEKWSLINVAKIKSADDATTARRLSLLFLRQAVRVIGTDTVNETGSFLYQTFAPEDLDKINGYDFPAGAYISMNLGMERLGIEQVEMVTYKDACEMGAAPQPTNDIQRVIWDAMTNKKIDAKDPTARWKRDFEKK